MADLTPQMPGLAQGSPDAVANPDILPTPPPPVGATLKVTARWKTTGDDEGAPGQGPQVADATIFEVRGSNWFPDVTLACALETAQAAQKFWNLGEITSDANGNLSANIGWEQLDQPYDPKGPYPVFHIGEGYDATSDLLFGLVKHRSQDITNMALVYGH